ncbi:MAG TPA: DUF3558 family protein [Candidatus Limnocylindrales bacterium]
MRRTLIALASMAILVAACGSSAATGGAPGSGPAATGAAPASGVPASAGVTKVPAGGNPVALDTCKLLTDAEAATALGEPVDPGAPPTEGSSSCLWSTTRLSTSGVELSDIGVGDFNPDKKSIPGLTITKVSGIGDGAYFISIGAGHQVLDFRKGQNGMSVSVLMNGLSDDQLMAAEKALALLVLGRI